MAECGLGRWVLLLSAGACTRCLVVTQRSTGPECPMLLAGAPGAQSCPVGQAATRSKDR